MVTAVRPVFQKQGPATNCVIEGEELGWKSCTAYAMAMGIDSATAGAKRPSGCKIRKLTGDTVKGLMLSQVAEVALEHYDVRVAVRTGSNTISPASALKQIRLGRGFVLQGNTSALPRRLQAGGTAPANHAVWVNEVRGGSDAAPDEALVYDPAADGRREGIDKGPTWWGWKDVLAFAAALELDKQGRKLGPGRLYAGFVPARPIEEEVAHLHSEPIETLRLLPPSDVILRFGATKTSPFPDRVRTDPPPGRRVNIRSRPDRIQPGDIIDRVRDGTLFIAYQKTNGARPPGTSSRLWYGNRRGTEWIHESGLRHIGGPS
jgi:hypothetical protein